MSPDSALAGWAAQAPEAPFVFFRGAHGPFEWISFGDAEAHRQGTLRRPRWLPADVAELLRFAAGVESSVRPAALRPGPERDVWIAWRPLDVAEESQIVAWAVRTGAAIVVERHDRMPVELFAWARPTLVSGPPDALAGLLGELARDAPKWLRRRWFRQRLGRLRAVLVEGAPAEGSSSVASASSGIEGAEAIGTSEAIGASLARLVPGQAVRCDRFSTAALEALV